MWLTACDSRPPRISVEDVWSRPTAGPHDHAAGTDEHSMGGDHRTGGIGVVYLTLRNDGPASDRLIAVRSDVCEAAEIHRTSVDDDRATMAPVEGGIELAPGETVKLRPGGYHVMLIGLRRPLGIGDRFDVVLEFERNLPITVASTVRPDPPPVARLGP